MVRAGYSGAGAGCHPPASVRLERGAAATPGGPVEIVCRGAALVWCGFSGTREVEARDRYLARAFPGCEVVRGELPKSVLARFDGYLRGRIDALDALEVELSGTPFELRVWNALRGIRAGATTTYGAIAREVSAPTAFRAVGGAIHRNPVGLVVPCHRVIGANGKLTGYAGGLDRKLRLLEHEGLSGLQR